MTMIARLDGGQRRQSLLGLAQLLVGLALGAAALYVIAGPPRLPGELPTWAGVVATLRGSELSLAVVADVVTTAAWLAWLWLAASLVLRLLVGAADLLAHGAAWVRALHALSDRVTLPVVRWVADGAMVALVIVNVVGRAPASATAANVPSAMMTVVVAPADPAAQAPAPAGQEQAGQQTLEYTVQQGDTLWALSERFYGTGHEFPRLVAANAGRAMPDGGRFTHAGVLRPGWVLLIPLPGRTVDHADGDTHYTVEAGDTLRGIAARLLGDAARWPEIFDLNRGMATLPDGRVLTDPDLIWSGLRLRLPLPGPTGAADPPSPSVQPTRPDPTPSAPTEAAPTPALPSPAAPTPAPPTASAQARTTPMPSAAAEPQPGSSDGAPAPLVYGAAGLAAVAVAGGAALLVRRVRRSLSEPPISPPPKAGPPPGDDFAEAELARALTYRLHGDEVEPVVLLAEQLRRFLDDEGVGGASVVLARRGRNATTLVLRAGLRQRTRLIDAAQAFGARMGGGVRTSVTLDHDVAVQLSGQNGAGPLMPPPTRPDQLAPLLPVGIAPNAETLYANWRELGHVLVAGLPGGDVEVTLTSLIAALVSRCRPEDLHLWTLAHQRSLPAGLLALPHQRGVLDPDDGAQVADLLSQFRVEVVRRMHGADRAGGGAWRPRPDEPELVLVVGELGELEDDGTTLELLGSQGAAVGVRLLARTTQAGMVGTDVATHFSTRFVLQTLDDDESIQLIGQPDAVDLGGGEFLLRIDGRAPARLRGFRVSAEHLAELARLMQAAYGNGAAGDVVGSDEADAAEASARAAVLEDKVASAAGAQGDDGVGPSHPGEPSAGSPAAAADQVERDARSRPEESGRSAADGTAAGDDRSGELLPVERLAEDEQRVTAEHGAGTGADHGASEPSALPSAEDVGGSAGPRHERTGTAVLNDTEAPAAGAGIVEAPGTGALLQVRCFGKFVVTSGEREITPTGEEGASYKAWEVLAFLAVHPEGAVSREKLLAAVWPDVDPERAGNRMRVAMARLRALLTRQVSELTAEVVRCERDGTCRLDGTLVWSDVQQFSALCHTTVRHAPEQTIAALERACAHYQGDLLAGRGTRFYEWVEERDESGLSLRERYREEYYRAMQRLAQLHCRDGQPARAVPLYKRLLKAEPTLEDVVRELYGCYAQLGDLSSLIREDRHLRQALREAYYDPSDPEDDPEQYQPEPETVELFNKVRMELDENRGVRGRRESRRAGGAR